MMRLFGLSHGLFALLFLCLMVMPAAAQYEGPDGGMAPADAPPETNAPPPAAIFDFAPFSSGAYFSSMDCGAPFSCDAYHSNEDYIQMADQCAASRLGFPQGMMRYFETSGSYENCVLPDNYAPKGGALGANAQWPICCVQQVGDQCFFICHAYISNGG